MKKSLLLVTALGVVSSASAKMDIALFDTNRALLESKAGRAVQKEVEAKATELQDRQKEMVADLQSKEEKLNKRIAALTPEAQESELMSLRISQRQAQRELEGLQEDVRLFAQTKQEALRRDVTSKARELAEQNEWAALLPSDNAVYVANSVDVTDQVIAYVDGNAVKNA